MILEGRGEVERGVEKVPQGTWRKRTSLIASFQKMLGSKLRPSRAQQRPHDLGHLQALGSVGGPFNFIEKDQEQTPRGERQ